MIRDPLALRYISRVSGCEHPANFTVLRKPWREALLAPAWEGHHMAEAAFVSRRTTVPYLTLPTNNFPRRIGTSSVTDLGGRKKVCAGVGGRVVRAPEGVWERGSRNRPVQRGQSENSNDDSHTEQKKVPQWYISQNDQHIIGDYLESYMLGYLRTPPPQPHPLARRGSPVTSPEGGGSLEKGLQRRPPPPRKPFFSPTTKDPNQCEQPEVPIVTLLSLCGIPLPVHPPPPGTQNVQVSV